jgi:hypothetical protein
MRISSVGLPAASFGCRNIAATNSTGSSGQLGRAVERIFGATIFFGTDALGGTAKVVPRSRFSFFREAQVWYSRDPEQYPVSDQFENVIVLSDEFYRAIMAHPIPADLEAVKVLARAPAVLDLFM